MPDFNTLVGQYLDAYGVGEAKKAEVAATSEVKKAALGGSPALPNAYQAGAGVYSGKGAHSADQVEQDVRTLSPNQLNDKYGPEMGTQLTAAKAQGMENFRRDVSSDGGTDELYDPVVGIASGFANGIAGIGALGVGGAEKLGIAPEGSGAWVSHKIAEANNWAQSKQSDSLNAHRRSSQALQSLDERDHKADQGEGFLEGLKRIGKDTLSGIGNTVGDPTLMQDGITSGIGSLYSGSVVGKAVGAVGGAVAGRMAASSPVKAAEKIAATLDKASMPIAIGAQEAGGAYQQTTDQALGMGASPSDANDAGLVAAAIQAPIAAATGTLVSKFEAHPSAPVSLGSAVSNMLRETVEEGIQSGAGQLAQNTGIKTQVDPNQDLLEGVGNQAAQGAVFSLGTTGVIQAPGVALTEAVKTAKVAGQAATLGVGALMARGQRIKDGINAEHVQKVNDAQDLAASAAPEAEQRLRDTIVAKGGEQAPQMDAYLTTLFDRVKFDPTETAQEAPVVQSAVQGATDRFSALRQVAQTILDPKTSDTDKVTAAGYLKDSLEQHRGLLNQDLSEAIAKIEDDHPELPKLRDFEDTMLLLEQHPQIQAALEKALTPASSKAVSEQLTDQHVANAVISLAALDPEKANPEILDTIRSHSVSGILSLTPEQKSTLEAASALVNATRDRLASMKDLGISAGDKVAYEAQVQDAVGDPDKHPVQSAAAKHRSIMDAVGVGDLDAAKVQLADLRLLAQHFQNKVAAYNANLASGRPDVQTDFEGLSKGRQLGEAKWTKAKPVFLNPRSEKSVKNAQNTAVDARAIASLVNGLVTAFPQLKVSEVAPVSLAVDPALTKTAAEIVHSHQKQTTKSSEEPTVSRDESNKEQAKPEARATEKSEVVEDNKKITPDAEPNQDQAKLQSSIEPGLVNEPKSEVVPEKVAPPEDVKPAEVSPHANLIGSKDGKNWFTKAFRTPAEARSRLANLGDQVFTRIFQALESAEAFAEFIGRQPKQRLDADLLKDYQAWINGHMPQLEAILERRLAEFVKRDNPQGAKAENPAQRWRKGKALNVVEEIDGKWSYNSELLGGALLSALQWLVTTNSRPDRQMEVEDVAKIVGVEPDAVTPAMLLAFSDSIWVPDAVQGLSRSIVQFWGVEQNPNEQLGYTDGIPEAVAKELISALDELQLIERFTIDQSGKVLTDKEVEAIKSRNKGLSEGQREKTYARLVLSKDQGFQDHLRSLQAFPNALETLALTQPEEVRYIGEPPKSTPKFQMRNRLVRNTRQQSEAISQRQNTAHRINTQMVGFLETLGKDRVLDLFGAGEIDEDALNKNHALSLKGQNATIGGAYDALVGVLAQLRLDASKAGVEPSEMPIYYAYNVSKVGRLQMQGLHNPQSSKLMREAILPTRVTLDLSQRENEDRFMLAIAQAWGVKVHKQPRAASVAEARRLAAEEFAPAMEVLSDFVSGKKLSGDQDQVLKDAFGKKLSFAAVHAAMELARFNQANDKSAFTTDVYVEADGVTDGPINALVHLATGPFSPRWIQLVAKGGLFLGSKGMTVNTFVGTSTEAGKDLYETTTDAHEIVMGRLLQEVQDKRVQGLLADMLETMDALFDGDLKFDGQSLTIKRGVAKNPLTITIYGSSAGGIAGNVVDTLVSAFYEELSKAAQNKSNRAEDLKTMIEHLASYQVKKGDRGLYAKDVSDDTQVYNDKSNTSYTLSPDQLKNLRQNVLKLFVEPLRESIEASIGDTRSARDAVKTAGLVQSIYLQHRFQELVAAALEERKKADPSFKRSDFLSQADLNKILDQLKEVSPFIEVGGQVLYPAGSENAGVKGVELSRALDDGISSDARIYGPKSAGVATIPYLNIAAGDGQMMLNLFTGKNVPQGALDVFDGVHLKQDTLEEDGRRVNQAVYDAWQNNPLTGLNASFQQFLEKADLSKMSGPMIEELSRALGMKDAAPEEIAQEIAAFGSNLQTMTEMAEARHRVLARVQMTVDHMASIESPFEADGDHLEDLSDLTEVEQAHRLNELMNEELEKMRTAGDNAKSGSSEPAPAEVSEPTTTAKRPAATSRKGDEPQPGVVVTPASGLRKLVNGLDIPAEQKNLLKEIVRSLQESAWEVVRGDREQTSAYALSRGYSPAPGRPGEVLKGYTSLSQQRIYLHTDEAETLVHELLHAAVTSKVLDHYQGQTTAEISETVGQLETLMDQWMSQEEDTSGLTAEQRLAFRDALGQVRAELNDGRRSLAENKAAALDEFLAWNLSNQDLIKIAQRTKVDNPFARVVKRVLIALKNLIWGRKMSPMVRSDMYSALRFNASVLINSAPTLQARASDLARYQSVGYGQSDRLTDLHKKLVRKIARLVNEQPAGVRRNVMQSKIDRAVATIGNRVAGDFMNAGFAMTMQEKSAFSMLVTTFATQARLDPAALGRAQTLYAHVNKVLDTRHFAGENPTQPQEHAAQRKLSALRGTLDGRSIMQKDDRGLSTLLPAFLALAMVNDEFRQVLSQLDLPKGERKEKSSLDNMLDNVGSASMDWVSRIISGEGRKQPNVQAAIDALTEQLAYNVEEQESAVTQLENPVAKGLAVSNTWAVNKMQTLSKKGIEKAKRVSSSTNNKAVKVLAEATKAALSLANAEEAKIAAEGWVSVANSAKVPAPVSEVLNDLVGRTKSNAPIFDLIKPVRSFVQAVRQNAREYVPSLIAAKFKKELSKDQWTHLFRGLAKTDLASLREGYSADDILRLISDKGRRAGEIRRLEAQIEKKVGSPTWQVMQPKAEQLAKFLNTGIKGEHLLRNATAVANLMGVRGFVANKVDARTVSNVDQLVSLYALDTLDTKTADSLVSLAQNEAEGLAYTLDYLKGQRASEQDKVVTDAARANHYKGYIPSEARRGVQLIVALDTEEAELRLRGFKKVAAYRGSKAEYGQAPRSYFYAPLSSRSQFSAGIMQNVRHTASGVDPVTGFTHDGLMTAGRIVDPRKVKNIFKSQGKAGAEDEGLMPIFDSKGQVVAYERGVDPNQEEEHLHRDTHLARMIGAWRGRQAEEAMAQEFNEKLVGRLHDVWKDQKTEGRENEFVDLFDEAYLAKDPVVADAVRLFTPQAIEHIKQVFGADGFKVRRDMVNDAVGYRAASIGDAWSGNTRLPPHVVEAARNLAVGVFGVNAYRYLAVAEKLTQNLVSEARQTIVVRSVIVPVSNFLANIYQMTSRGVRLDRIVKDMPKKLAETNDYVKRRHRQLELEADLRAAGNHAKKIHQIETELQTIHDANKRMSIWPLIEAGEFSSISEAGSLEKEELSLYEAKLSEYIEQKVDKLPKGVKTAVRYGLVTQDTALFQGMARAVQYGDFLAKTIRYDHLIQEKKLSQEEALASVGEEFINYDRLSGRFRSYLENMGLLWFYNFKIRSVKIALAMIRENPIHTLFVSLVPTPPLVGSVGTPLGDNVLAMAADGSLGWSMGPGMGFRAEEMNPWINLLN